MDEATALLLTLENTPADAPTACADWTAHELVAHLAAGAAEMADLVEDTLAARPSRPTRSFDEREAPFRTLHDDELRGRLVVEALRLAAATEALGGQGDAATVAFSGNALDAATLAMHGRSEAALHRWDLAGDDEISRELLHDPSLTRHGVDVLNQMLDASAESPVVRAGVVQAQWTSAPPVGELRLSSPGQPDVVVVLNGDGRARFELADRGGTPTVTMAADARLLAMWGRRSAVGELRWGDNAENVEVLATFLWGAGAVGARVG